MTLRLNSQMQFLDLKWIDQVDNESHTAIITIDFKVYTVLGFESSAARARQQALAVLNLKEFPNDFPQWQICTLTVRRRQLTPPARVNSVYDQLRETEFVQELSKSEHVVVCIPIQLVPQMAYLRALLEKKSFWAYKSPPQRKPVGLSTIIGQSFEEQAKGHGRLSIPNPPY